VEVWCGEERGGEIRQSLSDCERMQGLNYRRGNEAVGVMREERDRFVARGRSFFVLESDRHMDGRTEGRTINGRSTLREWVTNKAFLRGGQAGREKERTIKERKKKGRID